MASPLHSNCIIKLNSSSEEGGISVSVNYANFLSLDMDRIWGDSANSFTLKLLDKTAYEVEAILLKGNRNIYMKYYTTDSNEVETSKEFEGNIWDYSIDFINDKTILTITGTCGVKVKDIYTVYNRLWNRVPIFSNNADEVANQMEAYWGELKNDPMGVMKLRSTKTDNDEIKYQVSIFSYTDPDTKEKIPYYYDCDLINIPVRPSDIVRLIATGGNLSMLSPFNNTDINYDDFADSGFNFGTYMEDSGFLGMNKEQKTINWSTALSWYNTYKDALGNTVGGWSKNSVGSLSEEKRNAVRRTILSLEVMKNYFNALGKIESAGWDIGEIVKTQPICVDLSQVKMSNTKYISDVLASKSLSDTESNEVKANYYLSFKNNKLYFKPAKIEVKPTVKVIVGQYYNSYNKKGDKIYAGNMVLSYSYSSNVAAYIAGESSNELAGISYVTGEAISTEGISSTMRESLGVEEASYTDFNQGALPTLSGISSASPEELVSKVYSDWTAIAQSSFKAEVQLLGNTELECGDYIEIINLPGGRVGKHHTSGVYLIMRIKESISKGTYISTLTLVKNAANSGSGVSVTKGTTRKTEASVGNSSGGGSSFSGGTVGISFADGKEVNSKANENKKASDTAVDVAKTVTAIVPGLAVTVPAISAGVSAGIKVVDTASKNEVVKTVTKSVVQTVAAATGMSIGVKAIGSAVKILKKIF